MFTPEKVAFDFNACISEAAFLFQERFREKDLQLFVTVDPFIPRLLSGDSRCLSQLLSDLLTYTVTSSAENALGLEVSLQSATEGQVVVKIIVGPSGTGVTVDNIPDFFEEFSQTSADSSHQDDAVPGFATTKRLVEKQGGIITVESTPAGEIRFSIFLSYAIPQDYNKVLPSHPYKPVVPPQSGQVRRVLVVEDNDFNQAVLAFSLEQQHVDYRIANHGQEAIQLIEAGEQFDIILMDLHMPVMDGFQATAYIRQQLGLPTPIIILTATALRNERDYCMELGASDYLDKAVAMADLDGVLRQFIRQPETEHESSINASDFDISRLLELKDPEFIRQIFAMFTEKILPYLKDLQDFLPTNNRKEFLEKTHKVKGSLSIIQIPEIYRKIVRMEDMVQQNEDLVEVAPLLQQSIKLYEKLIPAINQEVEKQLITTEINL